MNLSAATKKRKQLVADLRKMADIIMEDLDEQGNGRLTYYQVDDCFNLLQQAAAELEKAPVNYPRMGGTDD